jgi:hypothetical protein
MHRVTLALNRIEVTLGYNLVNPTLTLLQICMYMVAAYTPLGTSKFLKNINFRTVPRLARVRLFECFTMCLQRGY